MKNMYKQLKKKLNRNPFKKINLMLVLLCVSLIILGYCMYQMNVFEGFGPGFNLQGLYQQIQELKKQEQIRQEVKKQEQQQIQQQKWQQRQQQQQPPQPQQLTYTPKIIEKQRRCIEVPGYEDLSKSECDEFVEKYHMGVFGDKKNLKRSKHYPKDLGKGEDYKIDDEEKEPLDDEEKEPYGCYLAEKNGVNYIRFKNVSNYNNHGDVICKEKQSQTTDENIDSKIEDILNNKLSDYVTKSNISGLSDLKKDISNNATGISNNASGITNNASGITNNESGLSNNATGISNNATEISNNSIGIRKNTSDIASISSEYFKKSDLDNEVKKKLASYTLNDTQQKPIVDKLYTKVKSDFIHTAGDMANFILSKS